MSIRTWAACVVAIAAVACSILGIATKGSFSMAAESKRSALAHNVYFTLNASTPENREKLVAACKKYLVKHPGVVFFACGTLADLDRPVNDIAFDVGLHIVFEDRASHDRYQTSPDHLKFIDENRADWKQVRVFDDDIDIVPAR